jgi:predicted RNA-binding Zn ribbon-like protein
VGIKPKVTENPLSPAGALCLDFANTAEWHASDHPQEHLTSYTELLAWAKRHGLFDEKVLRSLSQEAARRPQEAARVLRRAIELREALYQVLSRVARGQPAPRAALERVNEGVAESLSHSRLQPGPNGFAWSWPDEAAALERVLWPVMHSAADLLTSDRLARVGVCQDDRGCGWLFVDTSRNHTRRWCAMGDCGNRAKARRHHQRALESHLEAAGKRPAGARG